MKLFLFIIIIYILFIYTLEKSPVRSHNSTLLLIYYTDIPAFKSVIQKWIFRTKYKYYMKPPFREKITAMIIDNNSTLTHFIFQFINYLQKKQRQASLSEIAESQNTELGGVVDTLEGCAAIQWDLDRLESWV